jgi:hypothetical protein
MKQLWLRIKNYFLFRSPEVQPEVVEKELYIIDVLSTHRIRYVVECCEATLDNLVSVQGVDDLTEFSQEYLGDKIVSYHTIKGKEEYLKIFDEDNDYLKQWTEEQKLGFINRK